MMAAKFIVFVLLLIGCCYASPLRLAAVYGPPLFVVPVLVQDLDEPRATMDETTVYALNDDNSEIAEDTTNSIDVKKRSAETNERNDDDNDDDDLETAAGTNLLRPLFVYRQQVAYRQRVREAIRRGRRI